MSGKWVTVQSKTNKRPKRKAADSSDDDYDSDDQRYTVRSTFSAPPPPVAAKTVAQQIKAVERAEASAAARKEHARAARESETLARRQKARQRMEAEAAAKPTVMEALLRRCKADNKTPSFAQQVEDNIVGVTGAGQSSYLRALAVITVFERFFADVDIADLEAEMEEGTASEALMPMVALDSATDQVIDHLKSYVVFVGDGDGETMFHLVTECFGEKGAKEGCPLGQLYGLQLVLAANLEAALDGIGLVGDAFTAKGTKFHTLASFRNFLRFVDTIFFQLVTTPVVRGSPLESATKRGMVAMLRTLSRIQYDSIPASFQWVHRVHRTVSDLRIILEELDAEEKVHSPKTHAIVATPSDFTILNQLHQAAPTARVQPVPLNPFLEELVLWHHPDTVRSSFPAMLAAVDSELRTHRDKASVLCQQLLQTVLQEAVATRPAEVFGVWSDHFVKYPVASAALTSRMLKQKTSFDSDFLRVVRSRCEKVLSMKRTTETVESTSLREALSALDGKQVLVSDIVAAAKEERKIQKMESARNNHKKETSTTNKTALGTVESSKKHRTSEDAPKGNAMRNFFISVLTIGSALGFVFLQNNK